MPALAATGPAGSGVAAEILVTRSAQDAAELCGRIAARGFTAVAAPLFTVSTFRLDPPRGLQATLVTSRNAVAALPPEGRLLTVGDATAALARAQGFREVESASGDAASLARLAADRLDPRAGPLLLAAGARQGHALAADLRARGFRVLRRVCYRVRPVRRFPPAAGRAIAAGKLHAAIFLSAETASTFVRLLPPECRHGLARVTALAIGQTTADALDALPWLRVCRAPHPTLDGVLALL